MPKAKSYRPEGFHTATPSIVVHDAPAAIEFYVKAFGAKERSRDLGPGGKVWHAEVQIGDSVVMLADEFPEMGSKSARSIGDSPGSIWLYMPDVDGVYQNAVRLGATTVREPTDEFWGDRLAMIEDPFGHTWAIATHTEDVTPEEIARRRRAAAAAFSGGGT